MSIVIVPTPGTPEGPCRGACDHRKCHLLREFAHDRCDHCGVILGFGSKITGEPSMHLSCAQSLAARYGAPVRHPINEPITAGHVFAGHRSIKT
jgi:hypothetical protein